MPTLCSQISAQKLRIIIFFTHKFESNNTKLRAKEKKETISNVLQSSLLGLRSSGRSVSFSRFECHAKIVSSVRQTNICRVNIWRKCDKSLLLSFVEIATTLVVIVLHSIRILNLELDWEMRCRTWWTMLNEVNNWVTRKSQMKTASLSPKLITRVWQTFSSLKRFIIIISQVSRLFLNNFFRTWPWKKYFFSSSTSWWNPTMEIDLWFHERTKILPALRWSSSRT